MRHVRKGKLGNRHHLEDITLESVLHLIEIDLGEVLADILLRCIVDKHIKLLVPVRS